MAQKDTIALCSLGDLHHNGQSTHGFDGLFNIENVPHIDRFWNGDAVPGKDLRGVEFVSALQDALSGVGRPNAQLFDVPKHGHAVLGDGMSNSGDDGVFGERLPFVKHVHAALIDHQGEFHWVTHFDIQASLLRLLDDAARAVQPRSSA